MTARLVALVSLGMLACGPTPAPRDPPSGKAAAAPTEPAPAAAPAETSGTCRALPPAPAEDGEVTPAGIANCPDVGALARGDGLGTSDDLPPVSPSPLPEWDLADLRDHACAYACAQAGAKAHLLAWYVIEDGRPLRNHNAAFVVEHGGATKKWSVVVMYRHAVNTWWNVAWSHHSRAKPIHHFDHRPSAAEVYAVLDENDWRFTDDEDWRILAGGVVDPLWPVATGEAATRFYLPAIER